MEPSPPASPDRSFALQGLLRPLLRRSRAHCELCEEAVRDLQPWEVPPPATWPDVSRTVLLCPRCRDGIADPGADLAAWEFLRGSAFSDVTAVQVVAVRALRRAADAGVTWAGETLAGLYLPPDVEAWLDQG